MEFTELRQQTNDIINCEIKDPSGLNDFQKLENPHGVSIPKVGIERFRIPLKFAHRNNEIMSHDCEVSMYVSLASEKTGVNMSRFCQILQKESETSVVNQNYFKNVLRSFRHKLRDYEHEKPISDAYLKVSFSYPVKQQSLKSDNWGWQYYDCELEGHENTDGSMTMGLQIKFEYSSTCPCSLSMAKQYEQEFRDGKTTEGNGVATAHSQRSVATVKISYDYEDHLTVEDLVHYLRLALPTETQSLVKRVDEQAFAILNGENPMFVEHASRRISTILNEDERIIDWEAKVEHIESLHSHNAVAYIRK